MRSEEEEVAETNCDELTTAPITTEKEKLENLGVKLSLGRSQRYGEGVLRCSFIFSLSYFDLFVNKLNSFP